MTRIRILIFSVIAVIVIAVSVSGYALNENYKKSKLVALREYYNVLEVCKLFNLSYQDDKLPSGVPKIIDIAEGEYTSVRIHNFNEWIKYKTHQAEGAENLDPRIKSIGNNGIITIGDILENPSAIATLWASGGPMDNPDDRAYHNDIFAGPDLLYLTPSGQLVQERKLTPGERVLIFGN